MVLVQGKPQLPVSSTQNLSIANPVGVGMGITVLLHFQLGSLYKITKSATAFAINSQNISNVTVTVSFLPSHL